MEPVPTPTEEKPGPHRIRAPGWVAGLAVAAALAAGACIASFRAAPAPATPATPPPAAPVPPPPLMLTNTIVLPSPASPYRERVAGLLRELGIPTTYPEHFSLTLQEEAVELVEAGTDAQGRRQQLTPAAAAAWRAMRTAARHDGVTLELVSGFRSVDYQRDLIRRKLAQGQRLDTVLRANVPPGYSQHHTGCALDLATPGSPPLEEAFERTAAFQWLRTNATRFGFELSYPRGNPQGVMYEPWHWFHAGPPPLIPPPAAASAAPAVPAAGAVVP